MAKTSLRDGDALVIVDVQNDFLPGGALGVPKGDKVVPVINGYIDRFMERGLPIYATRDWHPENHCSFRPNGGVWPVHCIAGSPGAQFAPQLRLPSAAQIVSKATWPGDEAYSGFEHTDLVERLRAAKVRRLFIGGLATDYCVLNTVIDALRLGFEVRLLVDAVRAVDLLAGDGETAIKEMIEQGAKPLTLQELQAQAVLS